MTFVFGKKTRRNYHHVSLKGRYLTFVQNLSSDRSRYQHLGSLVNTWKKLSKPFSLAAETLTVGLSTTWLATMVGIALLVVLLASFPCFAGKNEKPVANADSATVAEGGTVTVLDTAETSVLANNTDDDGDTLTAIQVSDPVNGTLTLNSDGTFSYTHSGSETTTDSFTYKANDGTDDSNTATVSIAITPVNDAPVVSDIPDQTVGEGSAFATINLDDYVSDVDNTDAEMTAIGVIRNSVPPSLVVEVEARSPEGFDGSIPSYHRQLCRQTATLRDTSTSSVSIVRGSSSALRSSRQQRISSDTSSGVSSGRGIWCFSLRAKIPSIASLTLARALSRLSPWLTQAGRAGQWMECPLSFGSRITVNLIIASSRHSENSRGNSQCQ